MREKSRMFLKTASWPPSTGFSEALGLAFVYINFVISLHVLLAWFLIRYCTKLCTELCSSAAINVPNKSFELCSSAAIVPLSFKFLPNNLLEFEIYPFEQISHQAFSRILELFQYSVHNKACFTMLKLVSVYFAKLYQP